MKRFTTKQSMYRHIKYTCKKNQDEDLRELVRLLNEKNESLQNQIYKLSQKLQMQNVNMGMMNSHHNMNSNNKYDIKILNYNNTDYDHLTDKDYLICLKDNNHCVKRLIEKVHFDKDKKENHNIYISNIKNNYVMVYSEGQWTLVDRTKQITDLYDKNEYELETWYDNYKEKYYSIIRKFDVKKDLNIELKKDMLGDFRSKVLDFKPDIMLFSIVEDTFFQALTMLDAVADLNTKHLLGGVFPTMVPEVAIQTEGVNMIGLGEGEEAILKVSEAIRTNKRLDNIPSTWFKKPNGEIIRNPQAPLVELDNIVPDFSLFDESRFNRPMGGQVFRMIPAESYRGCPYSCTYCNSPSQRLFAKNTSQGNFLRRTRIQKLRDHLAELQDNYAPEFFFFVDVDSVY